jgi:sulfhydrogenase subunit delta
MTAKKLKLAVWKFSSCDGCQLSLLDCEDELLPLAEAVQIAYFPEATRTVLKGPYDLSLVEGSITTEEEAKRIQKVRKSSKLLITIGACATSGGIQALRNYQNVKEFTSIVYPNPEYISTLNRSTPIADHVNVDYELRGCPINKSQLINFLIALLHGRQPNLPRYSVCMECKKQGVSCVLVSRGQPCLGPVTNAGCNALCPTYRRGCFGCYGPMESASTSAIAKRFEELGISASQRMRLFRSFSAGSPEFHNESRIQEAQQKET